MGSGSYWFRFIPFPVHAGSRLTDKGYSVPGAVHGFPECRGSCGLLGAAWWPWEALEAIFVEQRFGPNPPEAQGVDRSSPQEGRLFGHLGDKKESLKMSVLLWAPWRGPVALGSSGGNLC